MEEGVDIDRNGTYFVCKTTDHGSNRRDDKIIGGGFVTQLINKRLIGVWPSPFIGANYLERGI